MSNFIGRVLFKPFIWYREHYASILEKKKCCMLGLNGGTYICYNNLRTKGGKCDPEFTTGHNHTGSE